MDWTDAIRCLDVPIGLVGIFLIRDIQWRVRILHHRLNVVERRQNVDNGDTTPFRNERHAS